MLLGNVLSCPHNANQRPSIVSDRFDNGTYKPHFAVWPDDSVLDVDRFNTRPDSKVRLHDFFSVLGVHIAYESRKAGWGAVRSPKNPKHFIRPLNPVGFNVSFPTSDLRETLRV